MIYSEKHKMFVHQVGDKVRVKMTILPDYSVMPTGYLDHRLRWRCDMGKWCGMVVTIARFDERDATYQIEEDRGHWWWCNDLFEGIATFSCDDDVRDIGHCSFGDYFEKFKVV